MILDNTVRYFPVNRVLQLGNLLIIICTTEHIYTRSFKAELHGDYLTTPANIDNLLIK